MSRLTEAGQRAIADISGRYGLSPAAVTEMARAVSAGGGTMAQFNIPELGGGGQWMAGGMTMVGDMFNHGLKATVDNLCAELASAMAQGGFFTVPQTLAGSAWWPAELGQPASVGGQNSARYAYFPQARQIAYDPGNGGKIILLDALDHQIGGWSQQQSGPGDPFMGISFSSQYGQFALSSLPRTGAAPNEPAQTPNAPQHSGPTPQSPDPAPISPAAAPTLVPPPASPPSPAPAPAPANARENSGADILDTIERLARLLDAGALTEAEFTAKKSELLSRL